MKLNKETLKQTVKKGYVKGKSFISEHDEEIKCFTTGLAMDLVIAGVYYIVGRNKGQREGYNKGCEVGYDVGVKSQKSVEHEWFGGMDENTLNAVVEYDKRRHRPLLSKVEK